MTMADRGRLSVISCAAGRPFADRVIASLKQLYAGNAHGARGVSPDSVRLRDTNEVWFANGEVKTQINENVRGDDVYVLQSVVEPRGRRSVNDNLMALLTAIDAARQADAESINVILPFFPYARQERKKGREGITASLIARFLEEAGCHRVIDMDIHSEALGGFFRAAKFENLHASQPVTDYVLQNFDHSNLVVVSPDAGGAHRARHYAEIFKVNFALIDKERDYSRANTVVEMRLVGNVAGRDCLIVDDMIDTGGSIVKAVRTLREHGARDIFVCCTHAVLSGEAIGKLDAAHRAGDMRALIATDTVPWGAALAAEYPWYVEVSAAPLFAEVIYRINHKLSVSALLR